MNFVYCSLPLFLLGVAPALAQADVSLVAADYSAPASFEIAPGQVVTLFFRGVGPHANWSLRSGGVAADAETLPDSIAGISARLSQNALGWRVPIFSVRQENQCGDTQPINPACVLTAMRVQIPFELALAPESDGQYSTAPVASLTLEVDGHPSRPLSLQPVLVNSHVITTCDAGMATVGAACERIAFHADGRRISATAPATRGEVIVVYALGLGPTWPATATGRRSPAGAEIPQSGVLRVWATIRNQPLNASATTPRFFDAEAMNQPGPGLEFAGLSPGSFGPYQINVRVPSSFDAILPCGGEITANALLLVTTRQGSEAVPFCVAP